MKLKEFIERNKVKIIKCIGMILVCMGILGLGLSIFSKPSSSGNEESTKKHYLCIGVDKFEIMSEREKVYNSIGQGDGLFLITLDEDAKTMDIVAIPRDTMVTVQKYYSNMEFIRAEEDQICLQYAYADGLENSCELTVDRVEELFPGVTIDGYVAINMMSIIEINNVIGGVTVTVNNADTAQKMGVAVGESVHLSTWDKVSLYLQTRDKEVFESAYTRMERFKDYIKAFIPCALEAVKQNPLLIAEMVEVLGEHMVTDMTVADMAAVAKTASEISVETITYRTLEGTVQMGEDGCEEFFPDKTKLEQIIEEIK